MRRPSTTAECVELLLTCPIPAEQERLRAFIRDDPRYADWIATVYLRNPFFKLRQEELDLVSLDPRFGGLRELVAARWAASRPSDAPRPVVFCMPKSGSSFAQSALAHALEAPLVSLTSFAPSGPASDFGMNAREQELDELAVIKAVLTCPGGFVAQHHTRYSMYLAWQARRYGLRPILTIRNVLDCIVSYDEMMLAWREGRGDRGWLSDPQFALPLDYPERSADERYEILARSFGVWLIGFYLSWARGARQGIVQPLVLRYEEDILDRDRFVDRMATGLGLTSAHRDRLAQYAANPDPVRSRLNVGRKGRGREKLPASAVALLAEHARTFRDELPQDQLRYLLD